MRGECSAGKTRHRTEGWLRAKAGKLRLQMHGKASRLGQFACNPEREPCLQWRNVRECAVMRRIVEKHVVKSRAIIIMQLGSQLIILLRWHVKLSCAQSIINYYSLIISLFWGWEMCIVVNLKEKLNFAILVHLQNLWLFVYENFVMTIIKHDQSQTHPQYKNRSDLWWPMAIIFGFAT